MAEEPLAEIGPEGMSCCLLLSLSQASGAEWTRGEGLRVTEDAAKKMADVVMIDDRQLAMACDVERKI